MSRTKDQDRQASARGHSRMSNFSPFRRMASQNFLSGEGMSKDATMNTSARGLGDVSEVPSISKAPTPVKPVKPAGLRVKKAKALSMSLLSGHHDQSSNLEGSESSANLIQKRQSRILLPLSPSLQQTFGEDEEGFGDRARSALDHYKEHGPTKGLGSPVWQDLEARDGLQSKKKKLSDWDSGKFDDKVQSDQLFIISRRPFEVDATEVTSSNTASPSSTEYEPMRASLGGFKRHEDERRANLSQSFTTSYSDPQSISHTSHDFSLAGRQRPMAAKHRSQSNLGWEDSEDSRFRPQASPGLAAVPFLNPESARAKWNSSTTSTQIQRKPSPLPLMISSATRRNSSLANLDRGPNSAPISSTSNRQLDATNLQSGVYHGRKSSTATLNGFTSHIPLASFSTRTRTQSHAGLHTTMTPPLGSTDRASSPLLPPPPPQHPPRHKHSKMSINESMLRVPGSRLQEDRAPHPRSSSPFDRAALHSLGQQLGGIGAAVGKRGWDMMKNWNNTHSGPTSPLSSLGPRSSQLGSSAVNEATRLWIEAAEPSSSIPTRGGNGLHPSSQMRGNNADVGGVFGRPLREAVLKSRLAKKQISGNSDRLSALDLGSEFSINLPELVYDGSDSQRQKVAVDRMQARGQYLPAVVVRCIEAIEKWGVEEEGIYRLSGRSSHTTKLKQIFDSDRQNIDLQLVDIGPAELDLNSVCSLLKAYLRALPDLLLTSALSKEFNEAVKGVCGQSAVAEMTSINQSREQTVREQFGKNASPSPSSETQSQRIAQAIRPLMKKLPAVNWYLLREIAYHLGDLTTEQNVNKTKMPLSNLCLVLAPTLSLSVAMVRVLVEVREDLFRHTCPLPDAELDSASIENGELNERRLGEPARRQDSSSLLPRPSKSRSGSAFGISRDSSYGLGISDKDWTGKRTSVATVKLPLDADKRNSSSSLATLQDRNKMVGYGTDDTRIVVPSSRPSSDLFRLGGFMSSVKPSPISSSSLDIEDLDTAPIAAHYLRKRSSSIANSIGSTQSSLFSSSRSLNLFKAPSSTSLSSNAVQSSTMDSSVPSLPDRDSPRTADDHWPLSVTGTQNTTISSSSNGSLTSLYKSSGGALDRPRPTTPSSTRFFSR